MSQQDQISVTVQGASNGLATAALVIGIIALTLSWIPFVGFFGFLLGIVAVGLGLGGYVRARARARLGHGTSIAGTIVGGVAVVLSLVVWVGTLTAMDEGVKEFDRSMKSVEADYKAETVQREACMDEVQRKQEAAADRYHAIPSSQYGTAAYNEAQREYMDAMDDGSLCY